MTWRPQLNVTCGRCGKPRGLAHTCVSASRRKATARPQVTFGACPRCKKPQGNPLTHTCQVPSDFRRRKARHDKDQKAAARRKRQKQAHDYQACDDRTCPRPVCVAYKTGHRDGDQLGHELGYRNGWEHGHARGFTDGIAACPRTHQ